MTRWCNAFALLAICGITFVSAPMWAQKEKATKTQSAPAAKPQSAKTLLQAAMKKAKASKKQIFVMFDASW